MLKSIVIAAALLATPVLAQTPATSDGNAVPRCSATVRDGCVQDERYASQSAMPSKGVDNNAMHRPVKRIVRRVKSAGGSAG